MHSWFGSFIRVEGPSRKGRSLISLKVRFRIWNSIRFHMGFGDIGISFVHYTIIYQFCQQTNASQMNFSLHFWSMFFLCRIVSGVPNLIGCINVGCMTTFNAISSKSSDQKQTDKKKTVLVAFFGWRDMGSFENFREIIWWNIMNHLARFWYRLI